MKCLLCYQIVQHLLCSLITIKIKSRFKKTEISIQPYHKPAPFVLPYCIVIWSNVLIYILAWNLNRIIWIWVSLISFVNLLLQFVWMNCGWISCCLHLGSELTFIFFFSSNYCSIRVIVACLLQAAGFLLVAYADSEWMAIWGVVLTSLSSGLGEQSFLAYSSQFNK